MRPAENIQITDFFYSFLASCFQYISALFSRYKRIFQVFFQGFIVVVAIIYQSFVVSTFEVGDPHLTAYFLVGILEHFCDGFGTDPV